MKRHRSLGSGTLVKRGSKYTAIVTVNGKRYTKATGCTTREEAEKALEEFVRPFRAGTNAEMLKAIGERIASEEKVANPERPDDQRLDSLVDDMAKEVDYVPIADGTRRNYGCMLDLFIRHCGKTYCRDVTEEDAKAWLTDIRNRVSVSRFNDCLVGMRRMFSFRPFNPFGRMKKLKGETNLPYRRGLTDEEMAALRVALADEDWDVRLLFLVGELTGLRLSDCCCLDWSEVDFGRNMVRVLPKKTMRNGKVARIPLHPRLRKALEEVEGPREGFVMPRMASRWNRTSIEYTVNRVFAKAGVPVSTVGKDGKRHRTTGFHGLRHRFSSMCVNSGIPVNQLQTMLAHSTADMSMHYVHTEEADLRLPDSESVAVRIPKALYADVMEASGGDLVSFLEKALERHRANLGWKGGEISLEDLMGGESFSDSELATR